MILLAAKNKMRKISKVKNKMRNFDDFITEGNLGNINAFGLDKIFDKNGKHIGNCMDTPNVIAYAFQNYDEIETIQMKNYGGGPKISISRDSKEGKEYLKRGLDPKLKEQYEKSIDMY